MALEHAKCDDVSVLFLHDAVYDSNSKAKAGSAQYAGAGLNVLASKDDVEARGISAEVPLLGYNEVVRLIFEHDKVISWSG